MTIVASPFPQITSPPQALAETLVNEALAALAHAVVYGYAYQTSSGLTWGYYGGRWGGFAVAAGTLTLTDASANYVVVAIATGVISASTATTNWNDTTNYVRVYKLTTLSGVVAAGEDHRSGPGGVHGQLTSGGGGGRGGGSALAATAWVETTGNDGTGAIGDITKPFATIDAALDALPSTGGDIRIGVGRFAPISGDLVGTSGTLNASSKLKSYVRFLGSGKPALDSETAPTTLVATSGTVIDGPFTVHSTHHGIKLFDLGIDSGSAVCTARYSGSAVGGLAWFNVGQIGSLAQCKGAEVHNVFTLGPSATAAIHAGPVFENCIDPVSSNTTSIFGTHGFVAKSIRGSYVGVDSRGHATSCVYFKESNNDNDTAPCHDNNLVNVTLGQVGSGDTPNGLFFTTGSTRDLVRTNIANVVARDLTAYEIKCDSTSTSTHGQTKQVRISIQTDNGAVRTNLADVEKSSFFVNGDALDGTVALTDATTVATDCSLGKVFKVTLGGNRTLGDPTNMVGGQTYLWRVVQDGTGSRTLALDTKFKVPGGTALVFSTTAGAVDLLTGIYDATSDTIDVVLNKAFA